MPRFYDDIDLNEGLVLDLIAGPKALGSDRKVLDFSKYHNNGTIYGPTWTQLSSGLWVMSFDGTDDYVEVPHSSSLDVADLTVSLWVRYGGEGTAGKLHWALINKNNTSSGPNDTFNLYVYADSGALAVRIGNGTTQVVLTTSGIDIRDQAWYHVAFTRSGTALTLYVDGISHDTDNLSGSTTNTDPLTLGVWKGYLNYFKGYIAEARIYNRALSAEEISARYHRTKWRYE